MSDRIRVVAAVIVREGRILIARRPARGEFGGKWEFPGGKVKPGESDEAALRREILEELSAEIRVGERVLETDHDYVTKSVKLVFFRCELVGGPPSHSLDHDELAWVEPAKLHLYDFLEADRPLLDRFVGCGCG
jgi:mutator protein MutT